MNVKIVHGQPGCLTVYNKDNATDVCFGSDGVYVIYYDTFDFFSYDEITFLGRSFDYEELS